MQLLLSINPKKYMKQLFILISLLLLASCSNKSVSAITTPNSEPRAQLKLQQEKDNPANTKLGRHGRGGLARELISPK